MGEQDNVPFPPGYEALEIAEITHVGYQPERRQALIWCTSTMGQKICLVAELAALNRATMQLQSPTLPRLQVVK